MSSEHLTKEVRIPGTRLRGSIAAPASKSFAQRAVAAALLANGETCLKGFSLCDDNRAALLLAQSLGAEVKPKEPEQWATCTEIRIRGGLNHPAAQAVQKANCGESGLCARLFAPVLALLPQAIELNGHGSLLARPFDMVIEALSALGATCYSKQQAPDANTISTSRFRGLPLHIQGPLQGGNISIDGSVSSQLLTGLLMALPVCRQDSIVYVKDLKSKPYIDVTLEVLAAFGVHVHHQNYERFDIPGNQVYQACTYTIEGDWSGASCWMAAQCFAGDFKVHGLQSNSRQADLAMMEAIEMVQANGMKEFAFDATDCPDLFPALVALAAACEGESVLTGTERLAHKESNRALSLQSEFGKLGIQIQLKGNQMYVLGGIPHPATVHSHNDHRIAMALAVTALRNPHTEPILIQGAEAVNKSYPRFWDDLAQLMESADL